MSDTENAVPQTPSSPYGSFVFKSVVLALVFYVLYTLMLDSTTEAVRAVLRSVVVDAVTEVGKLPGRAMTQPPFTTLRDDGLRLKVRRLATTNPAMHLQSAAAFEKAGDFGNAIEEVELAMGLLDLHVTERGVRERYAKRLQELKDRQARAKPAAPAAKP